MNESQPLPSHTRKLRRVAPLSLGKIIGVMYALMGVIFMPFFVLTFLFVPPASDGRNALPLAIALVLALLTPIFYGGGGFVFGVLSAWIYNLLAGWLGGIEVEIE